jgi:hypothetical protein
MKIIMVAALFHISFFHAVSQSAENISYALALCDSTISFKSEETSGGAGYNHLLTPRMLWENGKTYYTYSHKARKPMVETTDTGGRSCIIVYDERFGLGRPVGFHNRVDDYDLHHGPIPFIDNGKLYVVIEKHHNVLPIGIFRPRTEGDHYIWQLSRTEIGEVPTYPNIYKRNGIYTIINQTDDLDASFSINSSGDFEGAWTKERKLTTRDAKAGESYHYVNGLLSVDKALNNRVIFCVNGRTGGRKPIYFNKYLIKADVQTSGIRYYNFTESYSSPSRLTIQEQHAYFKYYTTGSPTKQGYIPVPALDTNGNFYDITGNGNGGYDFIYWLTTENKPVVKSVKLPGNPTLLASEAIGENPQNGACVLILARSTEEVFAFFRVKSGNYAKIFRYRTNDLGDTWSSEGDLFSDVENNIHGIVVPYNILDIPPNRNFVILANSKSSGAWSSFYFKKAAWGEIQPEHTMNVYDDIAAFTEQEYNSMMVRSYYIEDGKIKKNGSICKTVIDQSPSRVNANTIGEPLLEHSASPSYLTFDKKDDAMTVPVTGLTSLNEGTVIAVIRVPPSVPEDNYFLTASNPQLKKGFLMFGWSGNDVAKFNDSNLSVIEGKTALTPGFHIIAFVCQNGGSDMMMWVDGELQLRNPLAIHKFEGRFFSGLKGMTDLEVGRMSRSKVGWYGFDLKHLSISGTPFDFERMSRSFKYLGEKYEIELNDHFR